MQGEGAIRGGGQGLPSTSLHAQSAHKCIWDFRVLVMLGLVWGTLAYVYCGGGEGCSTGTTTSQTTTLSRTGLGPPESQAARELSTKEGGKGGGAER